MIEFLGAWVALYGAHDVADHWVQTNCQAQRKEHSRAHCAAHVATYGLTQLAALAALVLAFGLHLDWRMVVAGTLVNLGTHYFADRRKPLRWVASLIPGKVGYYDNGGAYALDQSWHKGWIFVSAIIIAL